MEKTQVKTTGFEVITEGPKLNISPSDLPWMDEAEDIQLKHAFLKGGGEFYVASVIRGKKLTDAAVHLDQHRSTIVNNLFYTCLPEFIRNGYNPNVRRLDGERTNRPIYCVANPGGQRVYFMRFEDINDIPVILRVAVCDKAQQANALSVLTVRTKSQVLKY